MSSIEPKNLTAQLSYEARGNPPGAHPKSAVGNFFPGLEFNFLNVWKRIFEGIELLESSGEVIGVDANAPPEIQNLMGKSLVYVDSTVVGNDVTDPGKPVFSFVQGPTTNPDGSKGNVSEVPGVYFLEWGNTLAGIHQDHGGTNQPIWCLFVEFGVGILPPVQLRVRRLLEADSALISKQTNVPGELTESLCSPWQTDFIGCACYYWAANRPDYINLWDKEDGSNEHGGGHHWLNIDENAEREMRPQEGAAAPKPYYTLEPEKNLEHEDIMQAWEEKLRFVIKGKDDTV